MIEDNDIKYYFSYLGFDDLLPHITCVKESSLISFSQLSESAVSVISSVIKQNQLPILNLSGNPIVLEKFLPELYKHFDPSQFFVLAADSARNYVNYPNVEYWPTCLLMQQSASDGNYIKNFKKKYRISALMRQTRLHRLQLWQALKSVATEQDVVVCNRPIENNIPIDVQQSPQAMAWIKDLPWYTQQQFFDLDKNMGSNFSYTNVYHPAYQACVNITVESWTETTPIFISEKTWKAYASACLVVNYGSAQVPNILKRLGFAIWEDYDACLHYQDKIPKIVELFQRNDIEDLYNKNIDMVIHNQCLFSSWHFARRLAMPAIEKIQNLL